MNLKQIVEKYTENGSEVDIKALAEDGDFRKQVIREVLAIVKKTPHACVLVPAFTSKEKHHLGQLINDLALTLQVRTLVTGNVQNFRHLKTKPEEVIILKQSFRQGRELKNQIVALENMGCNVNVICFMAHSANKAQEFSDEYGVPMNVLVALNA